MSTLQKRNLKTILDASHKIQGAIMPFYDNADAFLCSGTLILSDIVYHLKKQHSNIRMCVCVLDLYVLAACQCRQAML